VPSTRLLETRYGPGPTEKVQSGGVRVLSVVGGTHRPTLTTSTPVPWSSISANLAVANGSRQTFDWDAIPGVSSSASALLLSAVVIPRRRHFLDLQHGGPNQVVVDVSGYFV
jgi:hypothetical protein